MGAYIGGGDEDAKQKDLGKAGYNCHDCRDRGDNDVAIYNSWRSLGTEGPVMGHHILLGSM
jgi:hypothetical protein